MGPEHRAAASARPDILRPVVLGLGAAAIFFGGFGSWAALAPLSSAVLAPGTVVVEANRKTVQHLEGGIVSEILVADGQTVEAGDPLVVLDSVQSEAAQEVLLLRHVTAVAEKARLVAERDRKSEITFPEEVTAEGESLAAIRQNQLALFKARRDALLSQTKILDQKPAQLQEQIEGFRNSIAAQERQLALLEEEIDGAAALVEKGLSTRPRLLALQRSQAEISGAIAQNQANIALAEQQIGETELQKRDLEVRWLTEVTSKLREIEQTILDAEERLKASGDTLRRSVIRAPVSGHVMAVTVFTIGGVVQPGQSLMDIVPADAPMLIEARVKPTDIDNVHPEQVARVRLSAFSVRTTPLLSGRVVTVSADALSEPETGTLYFTTRIELDRGSLSKLAPDQQVHPGMPAEVMIESSSRTFLDYTLDPIAHLMERSFHEE